MKLSQLKSHIAESPAAFRSVVNIPAATGTRVYADVEAPHQKKDHAALDLMLIALRDGKRPPKLKAWLERTKGASKDTDLALAVLWLLLTVRRPFLVQTGASKQAQALELLKAIDEIVKLNPWLVKLGIEVQRTSVICGDARLDVLTSDDLGSHGSRPNLVVLNELTHVGSEGFASTLLDNADKMGSRCLQIIATNHGFLNTWQHRWRGDWQTDPECYFSDFAKPAPWIDPRRVEAAYRRDPIRASQHFGGKWVPRVSGAISLPKIQRCVKPNLRPLEGREPGWEYILAFDLGIRRDRTGIAVVGRHVGHEEEKQRKRRALTSTLAAMVDLGLANHPDGNETEMVHHEGTYRYRLAAAKSFKPPAGGEVILTEVKAAVLELHQRFGPQVVMYDPTEARGLSQELRRAGLNMVEVRFQGRDAEDMATCMITTFADGLIDLYDCQELLADIGKLEIVSRLNTFKLDAKRDKEGHADLGIAFAMALLGASRHCRSRFYNKPFLFAGLDPTPEQIMAEELAAGGDCFAKTGSPPFLAGAAGGHAGAPAFSDNYFFED